MADPCATAARWWLLECGHYGYGTPDEFMSLDCDVCPYRGTSKGRPRNHWRVVKHAYTAATFHDILVVGRDPNVEVYCGSCEHVPTLILRSEPFTLDHLLSVASRHRANPTEDVTDYGV